jgi:hypothetical protein
VMMAGGCQTSLPVCMQRHGGQTQQQRLKQHIVWPPSAGRRCFLTWTFTPHLPTSSPVVSGIVVPVGGKRVQPAPPLPSRRWRRRSCGTCWRCRLWGC